MKKLITLLLLLALGLSLCACGKSAAKGLHIGFSKVNITPDFSVTLGSDDDSAPGTNTDGVEEDIYLTCIAAREGAETILFFTMDTLHISPQRADSFRKVITKATGIAGQKLFFGATHAPYCPMEEAYDDFVKELFVQAAQEALADLSPATILAASSQAESMTFHRHYRMADESYAGNGFGDWTQAVADYVGEADQTLQVIRFVREAKEKKDVVLVNFQTHPIHSGSNSAAISPGHAGALRDTLETRSGCHVAYFNGASGNLVPASKLETLTHDPEDPRQYGQLLGQLAWETMQTMEPVGGSGIASATTTSALEVDHDWDEVLSAAQTVQEKAAGLSRIAADAFAVANGFHSARHADTVVARAAMPAVEDLYQGAFRIHDLGFVVATYEMFSENGVAIKVQSPYKYTLILSGNSHHAPSIETFSYPAYESDVTYYIPGAAEQLQEEFLYQLQILQ